MINSNDLAILKQIEAQIDRPLLQLNPAEVRWDSVGYILDDTQMMVISLYLYETQIEDLSPLADLRNLIKLRVSSDQISDLSPLTNLTSLISLDVSSNQINDLSPLADLTGLT